MFLFVNSKVIKTLLAKGLRSAPLQEKKEKGADHKPLASKDVIIKTKTIFPFLSIMLSNNLILVVNLHLFLKISIKRHEASSTVIVVHTWAVNACNHSGQIYNIKNMKVIQTTLMQTPKHVVVENFLLNVTFRYLLLAFWTFFNNSSVKTSFPCNSSHCSISCFHFFL